MTTKHLSGYYCDSYTLTAGFSKLVTDRTRQGWFRPLWGCMRTQSMRLWVPVFTWNRACLDVGVSRPRFCQPQFHLPLFRHPPDGGRLPGNRRQRDG